MYAVALRPGSWPPSPGFEPCGDLDLELVGAGEVLGGDAEPGRGDLLDPRIVAAPSGPGMYQAGSSPPSPVFAAPPARWMPIVSAWWASGLSAPTLIAETTNRRAIARASSTSSSADCRGGPRRTRSSSRGTAGASAPRASAVR